MSKTTIVPGVHDLIPPQGRVSVELFNPDTGRIRKRERVENALMDWYRKNASHNGGRGPGAGVGIHDYDSFNPIQNLDLGQPNSVFAATSDRNAWPLPLPPNTAMNWLWATNQNVTPDATRHHIPTGSTVGEVTSATKLDQAWVPDGVQFKRGSIQLASCLRTWDRTRLVAEFGLSYGNGIYRSIGLGSVLNQRLAPGGMRAGLTAFNQPMTPGLPDMGWQAQAGAIGALGMSLGRGGADPELGAIWGQQSLIYGGANLHRYEGVSPYTLTVSTANVPGSGGQWSVAVNGSDFWISRNKVLYRCVKPTADVAITVTNTYDLAATIGADTLLDISIDRVANQVFLLTETSVHVINGATGAPVSSFAHGLTFAVANRPYATIHWSIAEQQLFINCPDNAGSPNDGWGANTTSPTNYSSPESAVVYGFTTAGAAAKTVMMPQYSTRNSSNQRYSGIVGWTDSGFSWFNRQGDVMMLGPSMATHALLGTDVEKTSADALRITYDFDFAA